MTHIFLGHAMADTNQIAQQTVDRLNELLEQHGRFYVYAMISNPSNDITAVGIGHVTKFFAHPPNKRFRVGVEIFFDGHLHTTPSGAGGKITEAVRKAVGLSAPKPSNNFDGWNRLWFVIPSNVYSDENPRWLRMRFRVFLTRGMREAKIPFELPKIENTSDADEIYTVISSAAGESVVQLSRHQKSIAADAENDDDEEKKESGSAVPAAAAASATPPPPTKRSMPQTIVSSMEKRMKLVPQRLQRYMTALYTLSGTDNPEGAVYHVQQSCPNTLMEQLGIGITECHELQRTAKMMLRRKSQGTTAAV